MHAGGNDEDGDTDNVPVALLPEVKVPVSVHAGILDPLGGVKLIVKAPLAIVAIGEAPEGSTSEPPTPPPPLQFGVVNE